MLDLYATITFFVLIWNMFFNGTYFPRNTIIFIGIFLLLEKKSLRVY